MPSSAGYDLCRWAQGAALNRKILRGDAFVFSARRAEVRHAVVFPKVTPDSFAQMSLTALCDRARSFTLAFSLVAASSLLTS
jgi:hypothetical protein